MAAGTNRLPPVSDEAYDGWWAFAYANGADVAALCEAIGTELARLAPMPLEAAPPLLRRVTLRAADIKRQRASRRRNDD